MFINIQWFLSPLLISVDLKTCLWSLIYLLLLSSALQTSSNLNFSLVCFWFWHRCLSLGAHLSYSLALVTGADIGWVAPKSVRWLGSVRHWTSRFSLLAQVGNNSQKCSWKKTSNKFSFPLTCDYFLSINRVLEPQHIFWGRYFHFRYMAE